MLSMSLMSFVSGAVDNVKRFVVFHSAKTKGFSLQPLKLLQVNDFNPQDRKPNSQAVERSSVVRILSLPLSGKDRNMKLSLAKEDVASYLEKKSCGSMSLGVGIMGNENHQPLEK